jgi:hypothetical protein
MSNQNIKSTHKFYLASGVFKLDYKAAGYPDLMKIAQEWSKDPNFHELIIRGVSERNLGIQFLYISEDPMNENIGKYKDELIEKFGRGKDALYAWDFHESSSESKEEVFDDLIVLKGYQKNTE